MKKLYKIYYNTSYHNDYSDIYEAVYNATINAEKVLEARIELIRADKILQGGFSIKDKIINSLIESDLVITNISDNYNVAYEMGLSEGLGKPSIFIANQIEKIPADLQGVLFLLYKKGNEIDLVNRLTRIIVTALKSPEKYKSEFDSKNSSTNTKKIFVSYSHIDTKYLDRLKIHIKPLERNNLVELWSDTLIMSGEKWKQKIEKALHEASIAILLVSADFIASDFIINNELQPLLKNAEDKGTVILPVIVKPCRFLREPNLSQFQAINNPTRPLCKLDEYEQEEIYELVSQRVETALQNIK
jgi:predicted nucleotide-binding protein